MFQLSRSREIARPSMALAYAVSCWLRKEDPPLIRSEPRRGSGRPKRVRLGFGVVQSDGPELGGQFGHHLSHRHGAVVAHGNATGRICVCFNDFGRKDKGAAFLGDPPGYEGAGAQPARNLGGLLGRSASPNFGALAPGFMLTPYSGGRIARLDRTISAIAGPSVESTPCSVSKSKTATGAGVSADSGAATRKAGQARARSAGIFILWQTRMADDAGQRHQIQGPVKNSSWCPSGSSKKPPKPQNPKTPKPLI